MIDELKLLIEAIAGLPSLMMWVLIGFLFYKLAVIGSIYGLARLLIDKTHSWLTKEKVTRLEYTFAGHAVNNEVALGLTSQFVRLIKNNSYGHIYTTDVARLQRAIDLLIEDELKAKP